MNLHQYPSIQSSRCFSVCIVQWLFSFHFIMIKWSNLFLLFIKYKWNDSFLPMFLSTMYFLCLILSNAFYLCNCSIICFIHLFLLLIHHSVCILPESVSRPFCFTRLQRPWSSFVFLGASKFNFAGKACCFLPSSARPKPR